MTAAPQLSSQAIEDRPPPRARTSDGCAGLDAGPASSAAKGLPASRVAPLRRLTDHRRLMREGGMAPPVVHDVLSSRGEPLPAGEREQFEGTLGAALPEVEVHRDARAAESADAVGARAYTVGRHVVFGQGEYSPGSPSGRQVLAHELTHVLQQGGAAERPSAIAVGPLDDAHEHEAHRAAASTRSRRPASGRTGSSRPSSQPAVQRWGKERDLTPHEVDLLKGVYGSALNTSLVKINENSWKAADGVTRTIGNTINIKDTTISDDTLIHEAGHCYQNQRGDHYIASSLAAQAWAGMTHWDRSKAYDYSKEEAAKIPYDNWNSEQQAQWIENHRALPPSRRGVVGGYP